MSSGKVAEALRGSDGGTGRDAGRRGVPLDGRWLQGWGVPPTGMLQGVLMGEGILQRAFQCGWGMQARCSRCEDTNWNLTSVGEVPDLQDKCIRWKVVNLACRPGYLHTRVRTLVRPAAVP